MSIVQSESDVGAKKKKNNEAENKQLQWTWCSLPNDLQRLILERLDWVDRVRFCLTSNNFLRVLHEIPHRPADKLPWLFSTNILETSDDGFFKKCVLIEPFSDRQYNVRIMDQEARRYLLDATPFASSHGWVLLLRCTSWVDYNRHYFSLYRPYNKKFLKLPKLEICHEFEVGKAAISVDQTSLISVFYTCLDKTGRKVIISMCHNGATHWENLMFQLPQDGTEVKELKNALYADGFVYCVFDHGSKIVIFDVVLQDWKFYSYHFRPHQPYPLLDYYAVFNGDLLMLHTYWNMGWLGPMSYSWKFDKSLKQWVKQQSLGDLTLILGYPSTFPVKAVGELSSYANTVLIPADSGNRFMSFRIGQPECGELYRASNCWFPDCGGELYPACGDWFHSRYHCWIEPPLLT